MNFDHHDHALKRRQVTLCMQANYKYAKEMYQQDRQWFSVKFLTYICLGLHYWCVANKVLTQRKRS